MSIPWESAGVVAQILPVGILVVAFESRALRYLRVKSTVWYRHVLTLVGGLSLLLAMLAELVLVWSVLWQADIVNSALIVLVYVAGTALTFVASGLAILSLIANSDPSWREG